MNPMTVPTPAPIRAPGGPAIIPPVVAPPTIPVAMLSILKNDLQI